MTIVMINHPYYDIWDQSLTKSSRVPVNTYDISNEETDNQAKISWLGFIKQLCIHSKVLHQASPDRQKHVWWPSGALPVCAAVRCFSAATRRTKGCDMTAGQVQLYASSLVTLRNILWCDRASLHQTLRRCADIPQHQQEGGL